MQHRVRSLDPSDDPRHTDDQADDRAYAGPYPSGGDDSQKQGRKRNRTADQMVGGGSPGLRLEEGVVDDMHGE